MLCLCGVSNRRGVFFGSKYAVLLGIILILIQTILALDESNGSGHTDTGVKDNGTSFSEILSSDNAAEDTQDQGDGSATTQLDDDISRDKQADNNENITNGEENAVDDENIDYGDQENENKDTDSGDGGDAKETTNNDVDSNEYTTVVDSNAQKESDTSRLPATVVPVAPGLDANDDGGFYDPEPIEGDENEEEAEEEDTDAAKEQAAGPVYTESEALFGWHETMTAGANVLKDQVFDRILMSFAGDSGASQCAAVITSNILSWTVTLAHSFVSLTLRYDASSLFRDIGITVADIGARCAVSTLTLSDASRASLSLIGDRMYDALACEAVLHALFRTQVDWYSMGYYIIDAVLGRLEGFWTFWTVVLSRFIRLNNNSSDRSRTRVSSFGSASSSNVTLSFRSPLKRSGGEDPVSPIIYPPV